MVINNDIHNKVHLHQSEKSQQLWMGKLQIGLTG